MFIACSALIGFNIEHPFLIEDWFEQFSYLFLKITIVAFFPVSSWIWRWAFRVLDSFVNNSHNQVIVVTVLSIFEHDVGVEKEIVD